LKAIVIETVKPGGYSIINADDPLVLSVQEGARGETIMFSLDPDNPSLKDNLKKGNMNVTCRDENIIIQKGGWTSIVAKVNEIPITYNGKAPFNIQNAMAAVAATSALGLNEKQIRAGLVSFSPSIGLSPGRMNVIDLDYFKAVIDYGHNPGAIKATGELLPHLSVGRKLRMAAGTGNRRDEDIIEFGVILSRYYDHVVVTETDPRGRPIGVVANLVKQGLLKGGLSEKQISMISDVRVATDTILNMARKGDLVVLQADDVHFIIEYVMEYKNIKKRQLSKEVVNDDHSKEGGQNAG